MNDQLLEAIRQRQATAEFGYGITTADRYAKNVADAVGLDMVYKCAATRTVSWDDVLRKAARTLVYSSPDMVTEEIEYSKRAGSSLKQYDDIELPKNTLMVFRHVLTTPRKDRDGDVLRTEGAKVDPKLLLLWQHVHTLPIGKMLQVAEHNSKRLSLVSCIVDMNELSHDCAVMIDNDMGRFSHGFRAISFNKIKARDGAESGGFDVKDFEIMEASLVSVPSNTDAEVEEVMLGLVEGGKLTSPVMKEYGKSIRSHRSVQVAAGLDLAKVSLPIDLKITLNGKEISHEDLSGDGSGTAEGAERAEKDAAGSPKEADAKAAGKAEETATDEEMKCPECGEMMPKGKKVCPECGHDMVEEDEMMEKAVKMMGGACKTVCVACVSACLKCAADNTEENCHACAITCQICADVCESAGPDFAECAAACRRCAAACHAGPGDECVEMCKKCADQCEQCVKWCGRMGGGSIGYASFGSKGTKFGRTFSRKNLTTLKEIHSDVEELDRGDHVLSVRGREITKGCRTKIKSMIDEYDIPDGVEEGKSFEKANPQGINQYTGGGGSSGGSSGKPTSLSTTDSLVRSLGFSGQQAPQGNKQRVKGDYFETGKKFRKAGWKEEGTDWGKDASGSPTRTDKYTKGNYRAHATSQATGGVHTDIEFFETGGKSFTVEDAMGVLIAEATPQQRQTIQKAFAAIEEVERKNARAKQYRLLVKP